jgi:aspartyl-tRNA(Asn)/glutamyl-tRNA(Gln) amidotransferase subunit C
MASSDDVKKLAALARLSIPEEDLARFSGEFDSVLSYIGQIEELTVEKGSKPIPTLRNVFREDGEPREKGTYTKKAVEAFPEKDGNYLKVKQIINND